MNRKKRILHIAQSAGGVEKYLQILLKYMDKDKFENILICSWDYKTEKFHGLVDGIEQIEMKRSIGIHDLLCVVKVRKILKKYKPNIVYAHSSKAGAIARIANFGLSSKCIYNPHGWSFNMRCSNIKRKLYLLIEKILAPMCEKIICISEAEKNSALKGNICSEKKLCVIFNGIDIQKYSEDSSTFEERTKLNIPEKAYVIGMVGRMSMQKAPDIFIKTAICIKAKIPNSFFVIVGDGEQREELVRYAEENGIGESLLITGWVDEPMKYIRQFDVAMLLSRWEGFGLVLPEYMLANKPIVATNVDAIPNIIVNEENGLLVDVDDIVAATNAVMRIYSEVALTEKMKKNGEYCVHTKYDARRVASEHMSLLCKM